MKIQVLGPGCKRCEQLYENALEAVSELKEGERPEVVKVKDLDAFAKYGVFVTPALVVDENVISVGKVLSKEEIRQELQKRM